MSLGDLRFVERGAKRLGLGLGQSPDGAQGAKLPVLRVLGHFLWDDILALHTIIRTLNSKTNWFDYHLLFCYMYNFFLLTNGVTLALLMHVSYNAFCKIMCLVTEKCLYVRYTYSLILFKILSFIFVVLYVLLWNEYIHGALMNAEKTCCI